MSNISNKNKKSNNLQEFLKLKNLENFIKLEASDLKKLNEKDLIKGLRYFRTDLNYDLRKPLSYYKKRKVKNIRDIYISTRSVPTPYLYAPRKNHINATQEYVGLGKNWKRFVINKNRNEKIYFKNGNLRIKGVYTDISRGIFDLEKLIADPEKEINRVIKNKEFDTSKLICGDAYIGGHANFKDYKNNNATQIALLEDVNKLMSQYDNPQTNNYFENWLLGVELIRFKNQKRNKKKFKSKIGKKKNKIANKNIGKNKNGKTSNSGRRL